MYKEMSQCVTIINKQKCPFFKMKDRKVKEVLSGGLVAVGGGRHKERVEEVNMMEALCTHV
jgi:hypothetical protein